MKQRYKKRYIPERVPATMVVVGILLAIFGVMMTESENDVGWWLCGTAVVLQLTAAIIVKEMQEIWEQR